MHGGMATPNARLFGLKRSDWMLPVGGLAVLFLAVLILGWAKSAHSQAPDAARLPETREAIDARNQLYYGLTLWSVHETTILVRVVAMPPDEKVLVLKSWKGPIAPGQVLHVDAFRPGSDVADPGARPPPLAHPLQLGDELLIFTRSTQEPIRAWLGSVWPAEKSQAVIAALDEGAKKDRESKASAEAGDARGELEYGLDVLRGDERASDEKAALDWFRKSAWQGYQPAQEALGRFLSGNGWWYGVIKPLEAKLINPVEAYAWLIAAGEPGEAASLKAKLTPTQMEQADRLAAEYSAKYPPPKGTPGQQAALLQGLKACHAAPATTQCSEDVGALVGASRDDLVRSLGNPSGRHEDNAVEWSCFTQGTLIVSFNPAGVVSHARWYRSPIIENARCVP
jgi:hypothetical protein